MKGFLDVNCQNCNKRFWKYKGHVNENLKLGHNFYCSRECLSDHNRTGKLLGCDNPNCNNKFYRAKHAILNYNYCSSSCAAIVNNQRHPKWPRRYCTRCGQEFKNRSSAYCSVKCGMLALSDYRYTQSKYTKKQILFEIRSFFQKNRRVPAKREIINIVGCATNKFGSWNRAVKVAGLEPNRSDDHRMYKRTRTKANDGHICDSISEALIDNWLTKNNIKHSRDFKYPDTNHKADWAIDNKIFIEYFGLAKDSPRYDREIKIKKKLCQKHKINLIEIYPKDLYPKFSLDKKLESIKLGL